MLGFLVKLPSRMKGIVSGDDIDGLVFVFEEVLLTSCTSNPLVSHDSILAITMCSHQLNCALK
jgi:hypothetical protein